MNQTTQALLKAGTKLIARSKSLSKHGSTDSGIFDASHTFYSAPLEAQNFTCDSCNESPKYRTLPVEAISTTSLPSVHPQDSRGAVHITTAYFCQNCSLIICKRCKKSANSEFSLKVCPGASGTPIYGVQLDSHVMSEKIPLFAKKMFDFIERNELYKLEGFYRKTGSVREKCAVKEAIDTDLEALDIILQKQLDRPHLVSQLFKDFFRELPKGLLPERAYFEILVACREMEQPERVKYLKEILTKLPSVNKYLFTRLMKHLAMASLWNDSNRMDSRALSIVWTQCLIKFPESLSLHEIRANNDILVEFFELVIGIARGAILGERQPIRLENGSFNGGFGGDSRQHWARVATKIRRSGKRKNSKAGDDLEF